MIRKRKLLIIALIAFTTFLVTTNYLLRRLSETESEVRRLDVHDQIYQHLRKLPESYKIAPISSDEVTSRFLRNIRSPRSIKNVTGLWKIANSWVSKTGIVDFASPFLGDLYLALKTAKIIKADIDNRGTQLKLLLTLEGNQEVVFKPKWYDKEKIIEGPVYAGKDRYGSEIVAFYLSVLLEKPYTPFSVERVVSLTNDVAPVATKFLANTSFDRNNRTCVYGKCYYCNRRDPICDSGSFSLPGAAIFNINAAFKSYRSPWQRTYKKDKKAVWEDSDNYCKIVKTKLSNRRLLDLVETSIFDFLIQNGDRHHYETFNDNIVLLDNGKGFGNPHVHHLDILAPLYQCCVLRNRLLLKLQQLTGGNLRKKLEEMPDIDHLITENHLKALEDRLLIVFATIEYCKEQKKF